MPLDAGTRLGPYQVISTLGAEVAADVYKASDADQKRTVVIKVLPARLAESPEARKAFERDVRTLSGLNHPHICTPYEVRREEDTDFVVMECVEGETVAKRLERGPLPLDEALKITLALADALWSAHHAGVVHRNLRPTNIILTPDGHAKLVDFGLAKWEQPKPASTKTSSDRRTKATLPDVPDDVVRYLAPEQLDGQAGDGRADIFALGAIIYEMVTGERVFEGRNRPMLVAAIATLDPYPLSKTQPDSPPAFDHVVQRCLAKDPDDRWQTAHDLLVQLRWITEGGDVRLAATRARQKRERVVLAIAAGVLFLTGLLGAQVGLSWSGSADTRAFHFRVPVAGLSTHDIAMSPDGKLLALVARPNTQDPSALYVRATGAPEFRRLVGTEDAAQPFWSPDSRSIGFTAGGRLKRVEASGGAPKDLGDASGFTGGTWSTAGVILFGSAKGIQRVSAEGGNPEPVTTVEKSEAGHFWPAFLPDAQHYLYLAWSADAGPRTVLTASLASGERTKLMTADSNVVYADPGYILFHREATLFAQPYDPKRRALAGDAIHIADQVDFTTSNGHGSFAVSQNGALVYFQSQGGRGGPAGRGGLIPNAQYGWKDRSGRTIHAAGEPGTYGDMDLSPDGKLIAITQSDGSSGADIWVIDWQRAGVSAKLTLDPADDINPVWERPSGSRVAFTTYRKGNADIYVKAANGTGAETPLLDSPANESIEDWSKDGRYIAYRQGPEGAEDLWILPLTGDKKPFPIVEGPFRKDEPQFSYDGNWLAYTSDESGGTFQVFVISFPGREHKIQVSKDGGGQPRWREDGKELYFKSLENQVMAVTITLGPRLDASVPQMLLPSGLTSPTSRDPARHQLAVLPNGQQFLVRVPAGQGQPGGPGRATAGVPMATTGRGTLAPGSVQQGFVSSGLTVIRNWPAAFGRKAP